MDTAWDRVNDKFEALFTKFQKIEDSLTTLTNLQEFVTKCVIKIKVQKETRKNKKFKRKYPKISYGHLQVKNENCWPIVNFESAPFIDQIFQKILLRKLSKVHQLQLENKTVLKKYVPKETVKLKTTHL